MKPQEVTKVQIISPKSKVKRVINELYNFNALHIIEHSKSEELDIGTPLDKSDELSETIIKLRSLIDQLKIDVSKANISKATKTLKKTNKKEAKILSIPFDELNQKEKNESILKVNNIYKEFKEAKDKKKDLEIKEKQLRNDSKTLSILRHLSVTPDIAEDYNHIISFIGKINIQEINEFKEKIRKFSKNFELSHYQVKDWMYIALLIDKKKEKNCLHLLNEYSFSEIKVNQRLKDVTEDSINNELGLIEEELKTHSAKISEIRENNSIFLVHTEKGLSDDIRKAESPLMFGETKNVAVISGWIPNKNYEEIKEKLIEITENKLIIKRLETKKEDNVPIKLDNPKVAKSYETILRMFSIPSNGEIDPTIFMFFTFPFFFGFMLGDVGYGITVLLLVLLLRAKFPSGKALFNVMMFCAASSIIFGVAYGEFYGLEYTKHNPFENIIDVNVNDGTNLYTETITSHSESTIDTHTENVIDAHAGEGEHASADSHEESGSHKTYLDNIILFNRIKLDVPFNNMIYPVIHRTPETAETLLIISIIIGILHVNFGLFLGFINEFRNHGLGAAMYEKFSWILLEISAVLLGLTFVGKALFNVALITDPATYAVVLTLGILTLIVSIFMIFKGEGIKGIVELPSIFVNIASYARLMGVGFASVVLAVTINEMAGPMLQGGLLSIIAGVLIIVIGHTINIVLGIIDPFLHTLRLHYVEYFGKFYKGGGVEFNPFGKKIE